MAQRSEKRAKEKEISLNAPAGLSSTEGSTGASAQLNEDFFSEAILAARNAKKGQNEARSKIRVR
jgi:hypothetical protein